MKPNFWLHGLLATAIALGAAAPACAQVVISEFMAENNDTLADEDGDYSDWIEIRNNSTQSVNLAGWRLTDNAANLAKWTFPATNIAPAAALVVFASNKNRAVTGQSLHTNFKLDADGEYLALVRPDGALAFAYADVLLPGGLRGYPPQSADIAYGLATNTTSLLPEESPCRAHVPTNAALGTAWTAREFDDSSWSNGITGVGFSQDGGYAPYTGLDIGPAMIGINRSAYIRIPFALDDPASVTQVVLRLRYDDGFVAYLNGTEVARANAPAVAAWNSAALQDRDRSNALAYATFPLAPPPGLLTSGGNVLAVHGLNATNAIAPVDFLIAPVLDGQTVRRLFLASPTPGAPNAPGSGVAALTVMPARGFYTQTVAVAITAATAGSDVRYTLDGSIPSLTNGLPYTGTLNLTNTATLRARAFKSGYFPSPVETDTYLFPQGVLKQTGAGFTNSWGHAGADYAMDPRITTNFGAQVEQGLLDLPSVSLVMNVNDLFGASGAGIYPVGEGVQKATSMEWLDPARRTHAQIDCSVDVFGGSSVARWKIDKLQMRLRFRAPYGPGKFRFPVLGPDRAEEFDTLILENGLANTWAYNGETDPTQQRDRAVFVREELTMDLQNALSGLGPQGAYVHLYLNGLYWGLYGLHERPDESFASSYLGGDKADYDVLKHNMNNVVSGSRTNYVEMINLAASGITNNATWNQVWDYLDVPRFVDYMLTHFYASVEDWGMQNWYACRNRADPEGRWRYFVWDTEHGFENLNDSTLTYDHAGGPTGLHQDLAAYADYRLLFADHAYRHLFNEGALTPAGVTQAFQARTDSLGSAVYAESARWGDNMRPALPYTRDVEWLAEYNRLATNYFPFRTGVLLGLLKAQGLYPGFDPPVMRVNGTNQFGGAFNPGAQLELVSSNTVYYTLDGSDPRTAGTSNLVGVYDGFPLLLVQAVTVKTRARNAAGEWSALTEAVFLPQTQSPLRVTELMYHPRSPVGIETNWDVSDFEFIEFQNTGAEPIGLAGVRVTDGIVFDFSSGTVLSLAPHAYAVVVANLDAFRSRYPNWPQIRIAGTFARAFTQPVPALNDGGERVRVVDGLDRPLAEFTYGDRRGWPESADGAGHALVPLVIADQTAALDYGGNWRASAFVDGSPGSGDPEPVRDVVLNEVVAHTDITNVPGYDSNDWLELFNSGTSSVSLADWFLSDDANDLGKWAIPASNVLGAGAWRVFDEVSGFHNPITNGFGLNKAGETVFLSHRPAGGPDRVVDAVRFKGQENGASLGRYRDGEAFWHALAPTPGAANAAPTSGVVISEFLYHPAVTGDESIVAFIEIHNAQSVTAQLWSVDGAWRLDGGVAYTFPAGTVLAPGERVVVLGFDPVSNVAARAAFLAAYSLTNGQARLLGPCAGQLDNHGERLALEKPLAPDLPGEPVVWVIVDEVIYFDGAPWPAAADGTGRSLQRFEPRTSGRDPANWYAASPPTPGLTAERITLTAPEDGAVLFAENDEPLRAALEGGAAGGGSPAVAFILGNTTIGTDATAPFADTLRLPAPGRFALRAELTDAAGVWTSRTAWVTALALSNAAAAELDDTSAAVHGALTGDVEASVRVYWALADGGTTGAAWESSAELGVVSNSSFAAVLSPLLPGRNYAVRFAATAGGRTGWSPATTWFTTRSYAQWPYSATIRFPGYGDAETLIDFPALVRLGTNLTGFAYSQLGGSPHSLRFTDASGAQVLAYDVDVWNTNGESAVWVRIPAFTNGATIRACWGLAGMTNPPPLAARGMAWRSDDEAVWHWQSDLRDSTWRGRAAVNDGSGAGPGVVGAGRVFDGVDDAVALPMSGAWYSANLSALTISLWAKPSTAATLNATVFSAGDSNAWLFIAMNTLPPVRRWISRLGAAEFAGPRYDLGAWQLLSLVLSNGVATLMKNDEAPVVLGSYPAFTLKSISVLGQRAGSGNPFAGGVDEARFSRAVRSTAWLKAAYRTVAQGSSFTAYGPVASAAGDLDADGLPDAWEFLHFASTSRDGVADGDGDGMSDHAEFVTGTQPTNAASVFDVTVAEAGGAVVVGFYAIRDEPGSDGWARHYAVESVTGLVSAAWSGVAGYTNLEGFSGTYRITNTTPQGSAYYRGKAWLTPRVVAP